ncbi:Restriction endonuclease type I HsdR N-terminal [Penicillium cosmopolitanum]|uniref:Restriction endonuclease type I HsdR N-terminal n=1 Tax=Penicillium cosmopolitanum TaxID=1131564 RepID=A0A9W9VNJ9_9EURO|nr:Restriction endonuclease type I HsdR N-terminal [Penicillium cosmopolitanum]KAJ5386446.1 Restriction endonuclease type I HsdR N-terminal [Penicillium cosmopolitanum]
MRVQISPPNPISDEIIQHQLDRITVAAISLGHHNINRRQFQAEFRDVCQKVETHINAKATPFGQVKQMFPDLDFDTFKPLSKSWQESFANNPTVPHWLRTRFAHIGRNEEDGATRLGLLLHYAIRVKHFNRCRGYSDRLEIKSRTPFSNNAVQYQGKESSVLRAPDHSLWYGSEEEAAVQLVVFETYKCDFECSQKLRLCPCCEAEVLGNMAMVYSERKRRGEAKCGLCGLLTDHKEFLFYHVDDSGDWSYVDLRVTTHQASGRVDYGDIAHFLTLIFLEAPCTGKGLPDDMLLFVGQEKP